MTQPQAEAMPSPEDDADSAQNMLGYKLRMAQILAFRAFEAKLTRYGRAPRYLGLLATIRADPGLSQNRLADAVALRRSSLVNILDQLEADNLLIRKPSPTDRRRNGVWLTEKGQQTVTALLKEAALEDARMTKDLTNDEIKALHTILARVIHNLQV
ncbi:MarR family winged helix-turn-helix transcriptional regulator [Devosia sp.]|uniref:MarR family winged helix-turn-helix transcriptional regulator n=1 Tax=Devosia sp. TaxID=1871048 RepID=UPI002733099E|nr:MarR family transcriptional regulator [Devosia sp.]MDP2779852.1 MarR family transcriptional regulator [Devosia sp.]